MIAGSMVALVTPFDAQGRLDWDSLAKLVDFHLQEGTNAIVAVGTTGESATLDVEEHIQVIRRVVDQVKGRIPVIAGTGANSTREAVALTEAAKSGGADACLLVTPYYNKPTQEGMYQHFRHIAEAVAIPQILYNVPGRTSCDMLPETVERLSKVPNIIGIKEATGDLQRAKEVIERVGKDFLVYSGDDATAVEPDAAGWQGQHLRDRQRRAARHERPVRRRHARRRRSRARHQRSPDAAAQGAVHRIQPHSGEVGPA